jgi:ABC-type bacteriocin/lantibiotic exporter with double-glycine peptidase domain
MIGMLTPDQGDLIVNGIKCNDSYLEQWQSKCAYIPQDVFLINASIKNNIALGVNESEIDYGKLHLAIKAAQLEEVVMQDKMGLDSCVGEEGARLSGGQKQRVALARALYAGREVIFLDEATSALDKTTEDKIISNILSLNNQMTIILITHNESALQDCNKVFHVSNGSVV